jgi:hypothetical protein
MSLGIVIIIIIMFCFTSFIVSIYVLMPALRLALAQLSLHVNKQESNGIMTASCRDSDGYKLTLAARHWFHANLI